MLHSTTKKLMNWCTRVGEQNAQCLCLISIKMYGFYQWLQENREKLSKFFRWWNYTSFYFWNFSLMLLSFKLLWNICHIVNQGLANFFYKGTDCKYFWLGKTYNVCYNYSTLLLLHENNHRQYDNKLLWLCSNKTVLIDMKIWFHIIFTCHDILLLFQFFFNNWEM